VAKGGTCATCGTCGKNGLDWKGWLERSFQYASAAANLFLGRWWHRNDLRFSVASFSSIVLRGVCRFRIWCRPVLEGEDFLRNFLVDCWTGPLNFSIKAFRSEELAFAGEWA
jgi:hypothetical protein